MYVGSVAINKKIFSFLVDKHLNFCGVIELHETVVVVITFFASVVCLLISKVPPVRRCNNFYQMSEFQRSGIIGMREWGFSFREIGRRLGIHHSHH
jgi:hypothetical protein